MPLTSTPDTLKYKDAPRTRHAVGSGARAASGSMTAASAAHLVRKSGAIDRKTVSSPKSLAIKNVNPTGFVLDGQNLCVGYGTKPSMRTELSFPWW